MEIPKSEIKINYNRFLEWKVYKGRVLYTTSILKFKDFTKQIFKDWNCLQEYVINIKQIVQINEKVLNRNLITLTLVIVKDGCPTVNKLYIFNVSQTFPML